MASSSPPGQEAILMAKFNTQKTTPRVHSPSTTTGQTLTHEGGKAWVRDTRSELVMLAVTNMVGDDTCYEKATDRDARVEALVHRAAVEDAPWFLAFVTWLRGKANMRSASLVAAAEGVKARLDAGLHETFDVFLPNFDG